MFVYKEFIEQIEDCPELEKYTIKAIEECYRWVFSDIRDVKNFQPPAISANRANDAVHEKKCGQFATSFFTTIVKSEKRYGTLVNLMGASKCIHTFGTHIAKGKILETDGKSKLPKKGHFDTHLYIGHMLSEKTFEIIKEILIEDEEDD